MIILRRKQKTKSTSKFKNCPTITWRESEEDNKKPTKEETRRKSRPLYDYDDNDE